MPTFDSPIATPESPLPTPHYVSISPTPHAEHTEQPETHAVVVSEPEPVIALLPQSGLDATAAVLTIGMLLTLVLSLGHRHRR